METSDTHLADFLAELTVLTRKYGIGIDGGQLYELAEDGQRPYESDWNMVYAASAQSNLVTEMKIPPNQLPLGGISAITENARSGLN